MSLSSWFRKSYVTQAIVIGFVVLAFMLWSDDFRRAGRNAADWAAEVNGTAIPQSRFEREYENLANSQREGGRPDAGREQMLMQQALDRLITRELLAQEADKLHIAASDKELTDAILEQSDSEGKPLFKDDKGRPIAKSEYETILSRNNFTPAQFEENIRRDLRISAAYDFITKAQKVTASEVRDEFLMRNEKVNLAFAKLDIESFKSAATPSDTEIETFISGNAERIKTFYEGHLNDRFKLPEQAKVRRITIRKPIGNPVTNTPAPPEEVAKAKAKADRLLEIAKTSFEKAALESDGPDYEKKNEAKLVSRMQLEGPIAEQAFSATAGTGPSIVETPAKFVILQVDEKIPEKLTTLEDAQKVIASELIVEDGARAARDATAAKALEALKAGTPLADVVKGTNLEVKETDFFDRSRGTTALGGTVDGLLPAAFSATAENPVILIEGALPLVGDTPVLLVLKERKTPTDAEFQTQETQIASGLRRQKEMRAFNTWKQSAREKARIVQNPNLGLGG